MPTKIIATIGPKSEDVESLTNLLKAGVNIVRVNFSHASQEQYRRIRKIILKHNKDAETKVSMLLDLQGPRIRVGKMPAEGIIMGAAEVYNFIQKSHINWAGQFRLIIRI